jgi:hypothetical protein
MAEAIACLEGIKENLNAVHSGLIIESESVQL